MQSIRRHESPGYELHPDPRSYTRCVVLPPELF